MASVVSSPSSGGGEGRAPEKSMSTASMTGSPLTDGNRHAAFGTASYRKYGEAYYCLLMDPEGGRGR